MRGISGVFQGNVRPTERYIGSSLRNGNCSLLVDCISNDANEEEKELMDGGRQNDFHLVPSSKLCIDCVLYAARHPF